MNRKIALFAIPILAAIMFGGMLSPVQAGSNGHVLFVEIDIKPGSDSNPVNVNSKGVLPVAILGSENLDVFDIDQSSIDFDTPTNGSASPVRCNLGNVNSDGFLDLICFFHVQDIDERCNGIVGQIHGVLVDGTPFLGFDSVRWVNCPVKS